MISKFHPQVWCDDLLIGVPEVDEQHHMLVNMLSEASQRLSAEYRPDQLTKLVHDLMSYALYHFETEEALMLKNHYDPQLQATHIQEHRTFAAKIAELHKEISQGKTISADELLSFLSNWLRMHIKNTDQQLGKFLAETPRPTP